MYGRFFPRFSNVQQTANMEELEVAGEMAFGWGTESLVLVPRQVPNQSVALRQLAGIRK